MFEWFLNNLWAAFVLLIGYIQKQRDDKLKDLETKTNHNDVMIGELHTQIEVYKEKLDGLERVIETKLDNITTDIKVIKTALMGGNS